MTINSTDKLIVQRGGASYSVAASDLNSKLLSTDLLLVNRGGVSYKVTGAAARTATLLDTDLLLVNRGGVSYKATGAEVKALFGYQYSATMSGGWNGAANLFDGSLSTLAQHIFGQPEAVWDASSYGLSGTLEIYGVCGTTVDHVVRVNGSVVTFTPGVNPQWVSLGTFGSINSIGVTRGANSSPGLYAIRVAGTILVDS